ncbi:MAG: hypothetical protein ACI9S8_000861 [Chlamydiales bacterium]|jgi:hypothetical protein
MPASTQELTQHVGNTGSSTAFDAKGLLRLVAQRTQEVQARVNKLKESGDAISIADMFDMQMAMNKLSQSSEMATSVVSSANQAIISVTRNIK